MSEAPDRGLPSYISIAGLAVLAGIASYAIVCMVHLARWPYPIEYGEGGVILAARQWASGAGLYLDAGIGQAPNFNYPPLFAILLRFLTWQSEPFLAGRLINAASLIFLAALIGLASLRATNSKIIAIAAALLFLPNPEDLRWGVPVRVDALAAALSFACLLVGWRKVDSAKGLAAAALLGLSAWMTKQTAVLGPIALFAWLLFRSPRRAIAFAAMYGGVMVLAIGIIEWATHGLFLKNVLFYSVSPFQWEKVVDWLDWYVMDNFYIHWIFLAGWLLGLLLLLAGEWRETPIPFYMVAVLLVFVAGGKIGSSKSYFIEFNAACALGVAVALGHLAREVSPHAASAALLLISILAASIYPELEFLNFRMQKAERDRMITDQFRHASGAILAENAGWALAAGKTDLDLINPFLVYQLERRGLLGMQKYIQKVRDRKYGMIVLESPADEPSMETRDRYPPALLSEIARSYKFMGQIGMEHFYSAP